MQTPVSLSGNSSGEAFLIFRTPVETEQIHQRHLLVTELLHVSLLPKRRKRVVGLALDEIRYGSRTRRRLAVGCGRPRSRKAMFGFDGSSIML